MSERLGRGRTPPDVAASWRRAPVLLVAGFVTFLGAVGYLVASSLAKRAVPEYAPSPLVGRRPARGPLSDDTLTVDASDGAAWRYVDLASGSLLSPPDTAGWDVAFRRYHIVAADAIADLGPVTFEHVARAPLAGYVSTDAGRDTVNAAISRWYRYSMLTHLLEPKGHVYVVRTREGRYAKLQLLSYYCPGLRAGCTTFRYSYPLTPAAAVSESARM